MQEEKEACLVRREWKEIQKFLNVFSALLRIVFFNIIIFDFRFTLKILKFTVLGINRLFIMIFYGNLLLFG